MGLRIRLHRCTVSFHCQANNFIFSWFFSKAVGTRYEVRGRYLDKNYFVYLYPYRCTYVIEIENIRMIGKIYKIQYKYVIVLDTHSIGRLLLRPNLYKMTPVSRFPFLVLRYHPRLRYSRLLEETRSLYN